MCESSCCLDVMSTGRDPAGNAFHALPQCGENNKREEDSNISNL